MAKAPKTAPEPEASGARGLVPATNRSEHGGRVDARMTPTGKATGLVPCAGIRFIGCEIDPTLRAVARLTNGPVPNAK